MNRIFKTVWSSARNCWVVASELATAHGKTVVRASAPILAGSVLLAVASMAVATDYTSQVNGPATLNAGDTVTVGSGSALNTTATNTPITVNGAVTIVGNNANGAYATGGTIQFLPDVSGGASLATNASSSGRYALYAQNAGTLITASDLEVLASNYLGYAAYAWQGARIALSGGSVAFTGSYNYGLYANGASIAADNTFISAVPGTYGAAMVTGGGSLDLRGGQVVSAATSSMSTNTISVSNGSTLVMDGTDIYTGLKLDPATGQPLDANGVATRDPGRYVYSGTSGSVVYGLNASGNTWVNVDPITGLPTGNSSTVRMFTPSPSLGVYVSGAGARLAIANTRILTAGSSALQAGNGTTINATGMTIQALGASQVVVANGGNAVLNLDNSVVSSLAGSNGISITAVNNGVLNASNSQIRTKASGPAVIIPNYSVTAAVETYGSGRIYLTDTNILTQSSFAYGIRSWSRPDQVVSMRGGGIYTGVLLNADGDPVDSDGNVTRDPDRFVQTYAPGAHAVLAETGQVYLNVDPATLLPTSDHTDIVVNSQPAGSASYATHGLYVAPAAGGAVGIIAADLSVSLRGVSSNAGAGSAVRGAGLRASGGGSIALIGSGNRIDVSGDRSMGLYADGAGSSIRADNLILNTTGNSAPGGYAQNGAVLYLNTDPANSAAPVAGSHSEMDVTGVGLIAQGAGSVIHAANLRIATRASSNTAQASFIEANGAALIATAGAQINGSDLQIATGNSGGSALASAPAIYVNSGGQVRLSGGRIDNDGNNSASVLLNGSSTPTGNTPYATAPFFQGNGLAIANTGANSPGVYAYNAGQVALQGGSILTSGANSAALQLGLGSSATLGSVDIATQGAGAMGILLQGAGNILGFSDGNNRISTSGAGAHALRLEGAGASMTFDNTLAGGLPAGITVSGAGSAVLDAAGASITLVDSTALNMGMTTGAGTWGGKAESGGQVELQGISSTGGTGLWATDNSTLRIGGNANAVGSRIRLDDSATLDSSAGNLRIGSLESASAASRVLLGGATLTVGDNNPGDNGSLLDDTVYAGQLIGAAASSLVKTGGGRNLTLSGAGNTIGNVWVQAGSLTYTQDGSITILGNHTTADGATTVLGVSTDPQNPSSPSTLRIGGVFEQQTDSTLNVTLGASPDIVAQRAQLDGILQVNGFNQIGDPVRASNIVNAGAYTLIHTLDGITGDFSNSALNASGVDYFLHEGFVSGDGKDYLLSFRLAWTDGGQADGTGTFTVPANTGFDVDIALGDQSVPPGGFDSGWDGRSLTKEGDGLLVLSAANTYSGDTTINAGTLRTQQADTLGFSSAVAVNNAATLDLDGFDQALRNLSGNSTQASITLGSAVLTVDNALAGEDSRFDGAISGSGQLRKTGAGELILGGANRYTGTTTIAAGALRIGAGGTQGSMISDIDNQSALIFDRSDDSRYDGTLSGSGSLAKAGAGRLTVSQVGSQGSVAVQAGSLAFIQDGAFATLGDYTTQAGATTILGVSVDPQDISSPSTLAIGGAFIQQNGATLNVTLGASPDIVAQSAQLDGSLEINGFVQGPQPVRASDIINGQRYTLIRTTTGISGDFGNSALSPTGLDYLLHEGFVSGNDYQLGFELAWLEGGQGDGTGTFTVVANTAFDVDVPLGNQGGPFASGWNGQDLVKEGEGLLVLSAANTYTGVTDINAGILRAGIADTFADSVAMQVNNVATLDLAGYDQHVHNLGGDSADARIILGGATLTADNQLGSDTDFAGGISGSGSLVKTGAGQLTLSGDNSYTGIARIGAGTLRIGAGGTQGHLLSDIDNQAALVFDRSDASGYDGILSGGGSLTKAGAGTLTLSQVGTQGSVSVVAGRLAWVQAGAFDVSGDYITVSGATTALGSGAAALTVRALRAQALAAPSSLNIGGVFIQQPGATLAVTLGGGPDIVAQSVQLNGDLVVNGFQQQPQPVRASQVTGGNRYTLIHTTNGISGNFSNYPLGPSGLDYLLHEGNVSADGKDYQLGFWLAWNQGEITDGGGSFTLAAGTAFDVDVPLRDQPMPRKGRFYSVWDGSSLTKRGPGLLVLSAANTYSGATWIEEGTLQTGAAGSLSTVSAHRIDSLGVLDLNGYNQTIASLYNAGSVYTHGVTAANPGGTTVLTVTGTYTSSGGHLYLNSILGDSGSATDRLVVGSVELGSSGATTVHILNQGGLGAQTTGNGIEVIHVDDPDESAANAFTLADARVSAGAYDYRLGQAADRNWYLSSERSGPARPEYRPEVPLSMASPALASRLQQTLLGSYRDRVAHLQEQADAAGWARSFYQSGRVGRDSQDEDRRYRDFLENGPDYDFRLSGLQLGRDLYDGRQDGGGAVAGVYLGVAEISSDVDAVYAGRAGSSTMKAYALGGYWTHTTGSGFYLDSVVQAIQYRRVDTRSVKGQASTTAGDGGALSLEAGRSIALGHDWSVEPQVQLAYQRAALDSTADDYGKVRYTSTNTGYARIGAQLNKVWRAGASDAANFWMRADFRQQWGGDARTTFSTLQGDNLVVLATALGGTQARLGMGISGMIAPHMRVSAGMDYERALSGNPEHGTTGRVLFEAFW